MKNTLSINTVGNGTQISLQKGNEVFYCDTPFAKHSETLFDIIEKTLDTHNTTLKDLDCLGVVVGPGSFTGIRIGLSVVKAFAYVHDLPIIAVNSLEVLAYNIFDKATKDKFVCAVMNAGAGQVYYQLFGINGKNLQYETMPRVDTIAHFLEYLKTLNNVCVLGPDKVEGLKIKITPFSAQSLQRAISYHQQEQDFCDNSQVQPLYLRLAQVEVCKVKLDEIDMPLAQESESMALCGVDNQHDDWYAPWNVFEWQTKLLDPQFVCRQIIYKGALIGLVGYKISNDIAEIERLVVDKRARNQGVAKYALGVVVADLQKSCKGTLLARLDVRNLPAANLLTSMAFVQKKDSTKDTVLFSKKIG